MSDENKYLEALKSIAEMAESAGANGAVQPQGRALSNGHASVEAGCVLKTLPSRLTGRAAETAIKVSPLNSPQLLGSAERRVAGGGPVPQHIAVTIQKYWGPSARQLPVSFLESTPVDLQDRIVSHLNAWAQVSCVSFARTNGVGAVRISRGPGGYYSYLGTDILLIPENTQTMNLEGFTMSVSEQEFRRVVRHEAGHTLGFPHEHMRAGLVARIDREKAYVWFQEQYGWPPAVVDQQVLTPLDELTLFGTPVDQTSIMCYQLPGLITVDGQPIVGGLDLNATDLAFAASIYPKISLQVPVERAELWEEREDVKEPNMDAGLMRLGAPVGV
ncbi:hypothetical protein GCM10022221_31180 [Actinocorallia aurea]